MSSTIMYIYHNKKVSLFLFAFLIIVIHSYFFGKYQIGDLEIKQITFTSNVNQNDILIYATPLHAASTDFSKPLKPTVLQGKYVFRMDSSQKIRKFRIYIGREVDSARIENISLVLNDKEEPLQLSEFNCHDAYLIGKKQNDFLLFSAKGNGYLELKKERISLSEFFISEFFIFCFSILVFLLLVFLYQSQLNFDANHFSWKTGLISLFLGSIFLPQPIFNITFVISFALIVRHFNYQIWLTNKMALLFVVYFLAFLLNNIFVSDQFNYKILETSLPLFALPFYFACMPKVNYLKLIPVSALLISLYFILTSFVDTFLHFNIDCFSFDGFTKYVHPVYFSYLLFFSLLYIELNPDELFNKKIFLPILLFSLLCCGSKLIISLTVLFYAIQFFRTRILFGLLFIIVSIVFVLLFSPTRHRFQEIFNKNSLSVLSENPIQASNDDRLTGLTIRLIIWQESLRTSDLRDILFGKGVDEHANHILEERLVKRGLDRGHVKYDPHNQFITTYYKLGLFGLLILLFICVYGYFVAFKQRNSLLLYTMLLFTLAMFTESILQRAVGIYFFTSILSLLFFLTVKPISHLENSNTGN